jgi:hypothetical protein
LEVLLYPNNDKYNLINLSWSKNQLPINKIYENLKNSYKTISMSNIEGYTLLDWIKVFENAEEIHTVSSSNLFIIEKIKIDPKKVWIYPRLPDEKNLNGIIEFVNKDFNLIIYENG